MFADSGRQGPLSLRIAPRQIWTELTSLLANSEDHRGTPSAPGRVVTLIEQSNYESLVEKALDSPLRVWGAAYHIPPPHVAEVQAYLDIREVNGYSIQHTTFHQSPSTVTEGGVSSISNVLVYIGLPSNPQFTGPESVASVAEVIRCSKGPSGDNPTYLFMLEEALENLSAESTDEHVTEVAAAVRHLIEKGSGEPIGVTSDSTGVT